jgi:hypothetical protein
MAKLGVSSTVSSSEVSSSELGTNSEVLGLTEATIEGPTVDLIEAAAEVLIGVGCIVAVSSVKNDFTDPSGSQGFEGCKVQDLIVAMLWIVLTTEQIINHTNSGGFISVWRL